MYCVFATPSQVSFHHHLFPFTHFCLPHHPFPVVVTPLLSVSESFSVYEVFCLTSSPFHPSPQPHSLLTSVSHSLYLFVCFCFIILFCSLHSTGEIIRYLSFSDCLISFSIILSRSIHAVAKGKISFFLWLSSILSCKWTTAVLSTHLLMGTWAAPISWLL